MAEEVQRDGFNAFRDLKALQNENRRLKQMYAELSLDYQLAKTVNRKEVAKSCQKRELALWTSPTCPSGVTERFTGRCHLRQHKNIRNLRMNIEALKVIKGYCYSEG